MTQCALSSKSRLRKECSCGCGVHSWQHVTELLVEEPVVRINLCQSWPV